MVKSLSVLFPLLGKTNTEFSSILVEQALGASHIRNGFDKMLITFVLN